MTFVDNLNHTIHLKYLSLFYPFRLTLSFESATICNSLITPCGIKILPSIKPQRMTSKIRPSIIALVSIIFGVAL